MKIFKKFLDFFNKNKKRNKNFFKTKNNNILYKKIKKDSSLKKKRKHFLKYNFNIFKNLKRFKNKYSPFFFILFFILIIIGIGTLFSPIFKVKYIEIIKKDNLTNMNIAYKAMENIRGKSIFSIEKSNLLKKFQNYQENIRDIDLKLNLPNTLNITISSYKELFNTSIQGKKYLILENGSIIPSQKTQENLDIVNIVNNFGENNFFDYSIVFEEKYIKKISNILEKLRKNILGAKITNINFYNIERELHVKINDFTTLIFSVDDDISTEEQIKNLAILNKDHENINKKNIIYIDLRIKAKAFICKISEEKQCYRNIENIYPEIEYYKKEETSQSGSTETQSGKLEKDLSI